MSFKTILTIIISLWFSASPIYAAVYHIDPINGDDSGNGSAASPLKQWSALPAMHTGDDVYFKCDTTLSPSSRLTIGWGGTADNPAIIGAYYIQNGIPVYGVKGARPKISGKDWTVPENAYFGSRDVWGGLIHVKSQDYVHIKDLIIYRSGFMGVSIVGGLPSTNANAAYFVLDNVKVDTPYHQGISINCNPYNHGTVNNCEVVGAAYGWYMRWWTHAWPASLTVSNSPYAHTTISNNYVHHGWGEGISTTRVNMDSLYDHCGYTTIKDNLVWNNRRVDIYINLTESNTVRNNICVGVNDNKYASIVSDGRPWNQYGIWANSEYRKTPSPNLLRNNYIYNNLVAGHYAGIGLSSYYTSGSMENILLYNNTSIANRINYRFSNLSGYSTRNIEFRNNASFCPSDSICQDIKDDPSWFDNKILADNNAWTTVPIYIAGSKDISTNSNWVKATGWQNLKSIPSPKDFMPTVGNPIIGKGVALPSPYNIALSLNNTKYQASPLSISVSTFERNTNGDYWDIGAVPNQNSINTLLPPELSVKITN